MGPSTTDVKDTLRELRRTPKHFTSVASGLTDTQLRRPPASGSWSVHELLAHLRGSADVQGAWIARMLADDRPTIRYASPRTGMRRTGFEQLEFLVFLGDFERQRADLVKVLAALDLPAWARSATFTGTTPGWTPSVYDIARRLVTHEHAHFEQIQAAASYVSSSSR
jgi:hypothetical protein